jgi:hypothetical protein
MPNAMRVIVISGTQSGVGKARSARRSANAARAHPENNG